MKNLCRKLFILLLAGTILPTAMAEGNKYVQLLQKLDYGNAVTYVIGHKSPDPDAIGYRMFLHCALPLSGG